MTIYTLDEATRIVEMFEDLLCENGIKVPSPDDDQRDPANDAALYGATYYDLVNEVEQRLIDLLNADADAIEVGAFSGTM